MQGLPRVTRGEEPFVRVWDRVQTLNALIKSDCYNYTQRSAEKFAERLIAPGMRAAGTHAEYIHGAYYGLCKLSEI